jgi:hypothetical protein
MQNIGIFIENIGDYEISNDAFEALNSVDRAKVKDRALFFENVGPKPTNADFALFNSTEVWHFTGNLIVTFLEGLKFLNSTVNNKTIFFFYNSKEQAANKDLFGLIEAIGKDNVYIAVKDEKDHAEVLRLTGDTPIIIAPDLKVLVMLISNMKDK